MFSPDLSITQSLAQILSHRNITEAIETIAENETAAIEATAQNNISAQIHSVANQQDVWHQFPKAYQQEVQQYASQQAAWETIHQIEIAAIADLLNNHHIEFLIFKGSALAYQLYAYPYSRARCDTDIIFADAETAKNAISLIMKTLRYGTKNAVDGSLQSFEQALYKVDNFGFTHAFDIHWKITNNNLYGDKLAFKSLYEHAIYIDELKSKAPCLTDAFLIACLHRISHMSDNSGNALFWLYDIYLLQQSFNAKEWDDVMIKAERTGLAHTIIQANEAVNILFRNGMPQDKIKILQQLTENEISNEQYQKNTLGTIIANIHALSSWSDKLLLTKQILFPSKKYMQNKYQIKRSWLLPFYYLYRIFNGLFKHL